MGGYVREIEASIDFDGEKIVARLKPVKFADAMGLVANRGDNTVFVKSIQETMGKYLVSLSGPMAADGTQVSQEEFLSAAYFSQAVVELGTQWINKASPANPPSPGVSPSG